MSDVKLEEDVRRALRAAADRLVVEDRIFVPEPSTIVEMPDPVRSRRPRRMLVLAAAVLAVFVAAGVVISQTTGSNGHVQVADGPGASVTTVAPASTGITSSTVPATAPPGLSVPPTPADIAKLVSTVQVSALDAVGKGTVTGLPTMLPGPVLTENGKPRIVWIGAEYCPYCATERWALVLALSRFGTFSDLGLTSSSATDVYPNTQSFSFHGSTYSSQFLSFDGVETTSNVPNADGGYASLDTPTADQESLIEKYDAPPYVAAGDTGAIPFTDLANSFLISGATFSPTVLEGKTAAQIAGALSDPSSDVAKGVDGAANAITAVLCKLTNGQPVIVCSDPMIAAIESQLA